MFKRVLLRVTGGELKGRTFVLDDETQFVLGRANDCSLRLSDSCYRISRYHCRIKVFAPYVRIQDLGSLNGTYVNGRNIGQRCREQSFEAVLQEEHPEYPLWDGDQLRIGDTILEVAFDPPPPCAAAEPRSQERLWNCDCAAR